MHKNERRDFYDWGCYKSSSWTLLFSRHHLLCYYKYNQGWCNPKISGIHSPLKHVPKSDETIWRPWKTGKMLKIAKVDVFPQLSNSSSSPLNLIDLNGLSCSMWVVFLLITSPSSFSQLSFLDTLKSEYGSTTIQFHISEKAFAVIFLPSQFSNLFSQTENCFRSSRIFLPGLRKRKQGPGGCKSCARGDN